MPRRNKYLGTRVPDLGKKGLDSLAEVIMICEAIYSDYLGGRIDYKLAVRRLNFLKLIIKRDRDFIGKKEEMALAIVDEYLDRVKFMYNSNM